MIDCLYSITSILENPGVNGWLFYESGYRLALDSLDADEKSYGGDSKWDDWIARLRKLFDQDMRVNGFDESKLQAEKKLWPTLGRYISSGNDSSRTPRQGFRENLPRGFWREDSAVSHGTFQELPKIAVFLAPKDMPQEIRPQVEDAAEEMISVQIPRMAAILLGTLTEIQACIKFDGSDRSTPPPNLECTPSSTGNQRAICDKRHAQVMKDKGNSDSFALASIEN